MPNAVQVYLSTKANAKSKANITMAMIAILRKSANTYWYSCAKSTLAVTALRETVTDGRCVTLSLVTEARLALRRERFDFLAIYPLATPFRVGALLPPAETDYSALG